MRHTFLDFFFATKSRRRHGEDPDLYHARREEEYERMKSSNENTVLSPNLHNFFFLHNMGLSEEEHMQILRLQDYKYDAADKMLANMSIEFSTLAQDELSGRRLRPRRELRVGGVAQGRGKGTGAGSSTDRPKGGRRAFLADHGGVADDGSQGSGSSKRRRLRRLL